MDAAIDLLRQAVAAIPPGHPSRAASLSDLGLALRVRFERTGSQPDLDDAVAASRDAVAATPLNDPDRAMSLSNLGAALQCRFERTGMLKPRPPPLQIARHARRILDLELAPHIRQHHRRDVGRIRQKRAQPPDRRQLHRKPEPIRRTPALIDQLPVGVIQEEDPVQLLRDGEPSKRPYAAASGSDKNSTGTRAR